jgi:2,3-bisphosphoglycerate-dependent phosphoglycerate mutase
MKIYILRHEDRTQDATFFSPLTEDGLSNANKLIDTLKKLDINQIYSSPYIRTLQTVFPYCNQYKFKIKADYSLGEKIDSYIIPEKSYQVSLPPYIAKSFNVDPEYKSLIQPKDYKFNESFSDVENRIKLFLKKIIKQNCKNNNNNNILIVTHQAIASAILKIIKSKNITDQLIFEGNKYPYPKGGLTKIFYVNRWTFEPINWKPK